MLDRRLHLFYRFERRYFQRHDAGSGHRYGVLLVHKVITGPSHSGESTRGSFSPMIRTLMLSRLRVTRKSTSLDAFG